MYNNHIVLAIVAVAALVTLSLPSVRQWLATVLMHVAGWMSAFLLSRHHADVAALAVQQKLSAIKHRVEARFSRSLQQHRRIFASMGASYGKWLIRWEEANRNTAAAEATAAPGAVAETPQFLPLSPTAYRALQCAFGIGEGALTYMAFQLWHVPPIALIVAVIFSALLSAILGHLCGQAIFRREYAHVLVIGAVAFLYCVILGSMRFAYLLADGATDSGWVANAIGAFGWPLICMLALIGIGSQVRYLTPLEHARLHGNRAKERCNRLHQRAVAFVAALRDQMRSRQAEAMGLCDAYLRGWNFGWRREPLALTTLDVALPDAELESLWPPAGVSAYEEPKQRPTAQLSIAPREASTAS
ncbi:MAG TPA: hypothetical protein VIJ12_02355 [Candidatus Baltobacteraceae bacterium]